MEQRPLTLPETLVPLAEWLAVHMPGAMAVEVVLILHGGTRTTFPLPLAARPVVKEDAEDWEPTPFQQRILDALDGKAMRTDALGAAVNDRGRLFKKNGLRELRDEGLVELSRTHGYYRPDAPPPELHGED